MVSDPLSPAVCSDNGGAVRMFDSVCVSGVVVVQHQSPLRHFAIRVGDSGASFFQECVSCLCRLFLGGFRIG